MLRAGSVHRVPAFLVSSPEKVHIKNLARVNTLGGLDMCVNRTRLEDELTVAAILSGYSNMTFDELFDKLHHVPDRELQILINFTCEVDNETKPAL